MLHVVMYSASSIFVMAILVLTSCSGRRSRGRAGETYDCGSDHHEGSITMAISHFRVHVLTQTAGSKIRNDFPVIVVHAIQTQTIGACSHNNATIQAVECFLATPDKFHNQADAGPLGRRNCQVQGFRIVQYRMVSMVKSGNG